MNITNYTEQDNQFYPTPKSFLKRIAQDFKEEFKCFLDERKYDLKVLEPSAGKGDIAKQIQNYGLCMDYQTPRCHVECVEIDTTLRATLKGLDLPVVFDDFLHFNSYTRYDLIYMNPPFNNADSHLLKAIKVQEKYGGRIVCILNAETIKNPYTLRRAELAKKLTELGAVIRYYDGAFLTEDSERKTNVEVAVVWIDVPAPQSFFDSKIFEKLDKAKEIHIEQEETPEQTELIRMGLDWTTSLVMEYNEHINAALAFFKEYNAFTATYENRFYSLDNEYLKYDKPFTLMIWGSEKNDFNRYVELTRRMFWRKLFDSPQFNAKLTNRLKEDLHSRLNEMEHYDFTERNILILIEENVRATLLGIENEILALFDRLTKYAQYDGCDNIHYYNGWKTNSAHKLNSKIIVPFCCAWKSEKRYKVVGSGTYSYCVANGYEYKLDLYDTYRLLSDMSLTLNFLAGGLCALERMEILHQILEWNFNRGNAKNIETQHFILTFYKKGTCHLKFKNQDLLDKFNLFASQRKGWLPPYYGKKAYADMNEEEKELVKEFSGTLENYNKIYNNQQKYFVEQRAVLQLIGK